MSQEQLNSYEGMYIISAKLGEEGRTKALEKIQAGITGKGGEIVKIHDWGKRRLAYRIDGNREGIYYIIYFKAPAPAITKLWKEYHLNEDLIRFTTLRTDEVMEKIEFPEIAEVK